MKPIYQHADSWVLGICNACGRLNYVEPHGTTAHCKCSKEETEHRNIPYTARNAAGTHLAERVTADNWRTK